MAKFELTFDRIRINPDFVTEGEIQKLAQQELENTAQRLVAANQKGQNADGGALKGYSSSYKRAISQAMEGNVSRGPNKGKARPLRKKGGNTKTTLHLTGDLHEGFKGNAKAIPFGAELALPPAEATKAGYLEDLGYKDFFAIGKEDEARVEKSFERLINDAADKSLVEIKK